MTEQQELYEIEQVIRSVLTPNSYIVPQEGIELTKALPDWHTTQIEGVLDRLEAQFVEEVVVIFGKTEVKKQVPLSVIEAERNQLKEAEL